MKKKLAGDGCQIVGENGLKATLFVLIVKHHDGSYVQRLFAASAGGQFSLQVLQETIGEVVQRALSPSCLFAAMAAIRAHKFDQILLRIAVERCPAGVTNPYDL